MAPAHTACGSAVVKMNPGAYDRTASMMLALAAIYSPRQPNAFASVPSTTSMRGNAPTACPLDVCSLGVKQTRHTQPEFFRV